MGMLRRLAGKSLAERYLERGLYHLDKRKYEDALADMTAAIGEEPYNAELYTTRGFIYLESNNEEYLPYARQDFDYALYLEPEQWVAEYCLGMIAYAEEDYHEALRRFTVARDHAHLHPEVYYYRALCFYQLNDFEQAIKEMNMAHDQFVERKDSRKSSAKRWRTEFNKAKKRLKQAPTSPALQAPTADRGRPSVTNTRSFSRD